MRERASGKMVRGEQIVLRLPANSLCPGIATTETAKTARPPIIVSKIISDNRTKRRADVPQYQRIGLALLTEVNSQQQSGRRVIPLVSNWKREVE